MGDTILRDIAGLRLEVTFDLPFCLYLPDGEYQVQVDGVVASVQLTRVEQTAPDQRLQIAQASGTEFVRDRHGLLRYSRVTAKIPGKELLEVETRKRVAAGTIQAVEGQVTLTISSDDLLNHYDEPAFEMALAVVNRLVNVYRYVFDEFHVRPVAPVDIFSALVQWFQDEEPMGGVQRMGFGRGLTHQPVELEDDRRNRLQKWLMSDAPIPIVFELFADAKDHLDLNNNRLAVIDARTALEVLLDDELLDYFKSSNMSVHDICRCLGVRNQKIATAEEAVQWASINNKLENGLRKASGIDLPKTHPDLWDRWLKAKHLREAAAHRGRRVERDQAIDAVDTVGEIIAVILGAAGTHP